MMLVNPLSRGCMSSSPVRVATAPSLVDAIKHDPELQKSLSAALGRGDVAVISAADFSLSSDADRKPRAPGQR